MYVSLPFASPTRKQDNKHGQPHDKIPPQENTSQQNISKQNTYQKNTSKNKKNLLMNFKWFLLIYI